MAKGRMINRSLWTSHSIQALSVRQRYLFIGLFSNADDQGRLQGHPALIRNTIFPFDDIALIDVRTDLDAIERTGAIKTYEAKGKTCIQLTGWWYYQKHQWAYPSDFPPPNGWKDRLRFWKGRKIITDNWSEEIDKKPPDNGGNSLGSEVPSQLGSQLGSQPPIDYLDDYLGLKGKGKGKGKGKDTTTIPENEKNVRWIIITLEKSLGIPDKKTKNDIFATIESRGSKRVKTGIEIVQARDMEDLCWNYYKTVIEDDRHYNADGSRRVNDGQRRTKQGKQETPPKKEGRAVSTPTTQDGRGILKPGRAVR